MNRKKCGSEKKIDDVIEAYLAAYIAEAGEPLEVYLIGSSLKKTTYDGGDIDLVFITNGPLTTSRQKFTSPSDFARFLGIIHEQEVQSTDEEYKKFLLARGYKKIK
ncbi:MAG: hypothetical protein AAB408_05440 [Patescibacteria group bacterium]